MDKPERDLFREARKRRKLTQIAAAAAGEIKQSTISKIEIEPDYSPSVEVFKKALRGIGLTIESFYAQIEGGSGLEQPQVADHESLPPLSSDLGMAQAAIHRLTQRISTLERRLEAHTRVRKADDRPASAARAQAAERSAARRDRRKGDARRKDKGKGKGE